MTVTTLTEPLVLIDRNAAVDRLGGDIELLREVAALFLEAQDEYLGQIREAADNGDIKALAETAHGLKGSVANFCAKDAYDAAYRLEMMGRKGAAPDREEVEQALHSLELALMALRPELARI